MKSYGSRRPEWALQALGSILVLALSACASVAPPAPVISWPEGLPVYDHIVIVVEENKDYAEGRGITHVNILRTIEAMYGLPKAGVQQKNAAKGGISDDFIITDVFAGAPPSVQ